MTVKVELPNIPSEDVHVIEPPGRPGNRTDRDECMVNHYPALSSSQVKKAHQHDKGCNSLFHRDEYGIKSYFSALLIP